MIKIITRQLAESLPPGHSLKKQTAIDPTNFKTIFYLFNSTDNRELCIFDATITTKIKQQQIIQVKDHINNTGTNILTGKQNILGIDFTDLTDLYIHDQASIITECIRPTC